MGLTVFFYFVPFFMAFSLRSVLSFATLMLSKPLDILALFLSASETFPEKVLINKKRLGIHYTVREAQLRILILRIRNHSFVHRP